MPVSLTITARSGPDKALTAAVFTGLTGLLFLPDRKVLQAFTGGDTNSPPAKEFDLSTATTVTCTVTTTTNTYAFVVS